MYNVQSTDYGVGGTYTVKCLGHHNILIRRWTDIIRFHALSCHLHSCTKNYYRRHGY